MVFGVRYWAKSSFGQGQQSVHSVVKVPEGQKDGGAPHCLSECRKIPRLLHLSCSEPVPSFGTGAQAQGLTGV